MSERQNLINRLLADRELRADYVRAKLEVLIPSQLRALRLKNEQTQLELAKASDMKQARISAMETPGKVNFNLDTLVRMAATHGIGLTVQFVSMSEMLEWENEYRQDAFRVTKLRDDKDFLFPHEKRNIFRNKRARRRIRSTHSLSTNQQQGIQSSFTFAVSPISVSSLAVMIPQETSLPKNRVVPFSTKSPVGRSSYFESKTADGGADEYERRYSKVYGD